ncbi:hypothetical protein BG006_007954 [Podila minutissima]|uniref:Uncharacterized protein n=1 Tax=Podila minutissima TaxID=64525 RepID=A0A9P5SVX6_9FUNG|nr:hypothetical protein BG006_007954 [Podila minutissima]
MAAVLALALVASTEATLNCQSPTGSYPVGNSVSMRWGDNGWWPKAGDVYSATANVYCSSGEKITSFGVSNGDSWTIPDSAYGRCSGNQLYVEYTGSLWDVAHWFHVLPYWNKCSSFTVSARPPPPSPTPPPQPPSTTQQPPKTTDRPPEPPTAPNPQPTTVPPVPTATQAPVITPPPPVFTTTLTLVPTVIDGTTTVVPATTVIQVNTTAVAPPGVTQTTASFNPNASVIPPGLPSGAGGQSNRNNNNNNNNSNVPIAALASVGGVAALALIVFGLVMTRKHKRLRREQVLDKENNYSYGAELGSAAAGGAAVAAAVAAPASTHSSFDDHPMPYLSPPPPVSQNYHNPDYDLLAAGAGATVTSRGMGEYGHEEGFASLNPHHISDSLAFPVPPSTVNASAVAALQQQFALACRLSLESQESAGLAAAVAGAGAAAAAVNQQLSLKQEFDQDDDHHSVGSDGLYYLQTNSPVQIFQSAVGTPVSTVDGSGRAATPVMTDATTRSSAYDTVPSSSSAYATAAADSPTLSVASLQSQDIHVPAMQPSDWRLTGSGRPESSHIRDLIRNVLDD